MFWGLSTTCFDTHTWEDQFQIISPAASQPSLASATPSASAIQISHEAYQSELVDALITPGAETGTLDATMPDAQATIEERFEYLLRCARHMGFDNFDTMAAQYYARDFNPTSALASEQRLSRKRRLPELLAELRTQSTTWSAWQRRGYEDEILRAAEAICVLEYHESSKRKAGTHYPQAQRDTGLEETT
ncbi:hypothetical protein N0V82_000845 [Gnomoniopsis sp. IMI 355080]|nr:hypothetical protein N0V82_000845 [Gnomoniopsis sp. IMI 355080]